MSKTASKYYDLHKDQERISRYLEDIEILQKTIDQIENIKNISDHE